MSAEELRFRLSTKRCRCEEIIILSNIISNIEQKLGVRYLLGQLSEFSKKT